MVIARSVRGMNDLFASDLAAFQKIESSIKQIFTTFGYEEIRTPILEELALFKRSVGETSDIVEKEMFLVKDGDHTYCLRPENTAPVVRALIERGGINEDSQEKLYYIGPMFRKERPQKARLRQFHQFGIELFGVAEPTADIEVMVIVNELFTTLGLPGISLKINTLGTNEERVHYKSLLHSFLSNHLNQLCEDCKRRMATNPLRVLDCKNANCQALSAVAPNIIETLGQGSRMHFDQVLKGLNDQKISFNIDHQLVRGLDYYNRTVFEFVADIGLGAQNAVVAGGRYDGLFLTLGHKVDLPAIGFAGGIERMALLLANNNKMPASNIKLALVGADDEGHQQAMNLSFTLRKQGINADFSLLKKSTKAQMRRADRLGAKYVMVLGEHELRSGKVTIKNLVNGQQTEITLDAKNIADFIIHDSD